MFGTISFERLLEVTAKDLDEIKHNLGEVYGDDTIDPEVRCTALADAFKTIDDWSSYFNKFKGIQDSKLDELSRENDHLADENKRLNNELNKLTTNYNKQSVILGNMQATIDYLNKLVDAKNNSSNMVQVDIVEMVEKLEAIANSYESAIKAAEHRAAMKTFNKRVASGEVKPAKRADISDEYIIENVNNGVSAYKIAQSVGMTQQAILYRIKKLREAGLIK